LRVDQLEPSRLWNWTDSEPQGLSLPNYLRDQSAFLPKGRCLKFDILNGASYEYLDLVQA